MQTRLSSGLAPVFTRWSVVLPLWLAFFVVVGQPARAPAQATPFTYQGQLTDGGAAANGNYDLALGLFATATAGERIGSPQTVFNVPVSNGLFTVQVDFGVNAFPGADRFLEIGVRAAGGDNFVTLAPRQQISSTPYAIRTLSAGTADMLSSTCTACVQDSQIQSVAGSKVSGTIPVTSVPAGSGHYIQNATGQQPNADFNISGNGTVGGDLTVNGTLNAKLSGFIQDRTTPQDADFNITGNGTVGQTLHAKVIGVDAASPNGALEVSRNWDGHYGALTLSGDRPTIRFSGTSPQGNQQWILHESGNGPGNLEIYNGGTSGTFSVPALSLTPNGNMTLLSGNLTLSAGNLTLSSGNVGIGTTSAPVARLDAIGAGGGIGIRGASDARGVIGSLGAGGCPASGTNAGFGVGGCGSTTGDGVVGRTSVGPNTVTAAAVRAINDSGGDIFIGENRAVTLNVSPRKARIDGTGKGFFNGGTQTGGADYADSIRTTDNAADLEPGDVLAIDPQHKDMVRKSRQPNSRLVAGVYSTQPSVLGVGKHEIDDSLRGEVPVALLGVVPTKVTAENGPIRSGDLLVTSSLPGRAMKALPKMVDGVALYPTGAILGKALEPLRQGRGVIRVLVTLR